ncbi:MAG: RraA family protein [Anaerolineales bacterium]|nr:RraA family protein [Anaerolineales bacterium]
MKIILFVNLLIFCFAINLIAQTASNADLLNGIGFIGTKTYTEAENVEVLKMYEELRVADVSDGMDYVGLSKVGLVDMSIHPDWTNTDDLSHVFRGIALTVRFVPTQRSLFPEPNRPYREWEGEFYNKYSAEPFTNIIQKGSAIMIDDDEYGDIGSIGSYNILDWYKHGAVGVVTDAASRDTDEIAKEKVPLYLRKKGRGIRPGRNELESVNKPIVIGGVLVCPGDVVVADGDGVIVVPRKVAKEVAEFAHMILDADKKGRTQLYKDLNMEPDQTVN